MGDKIKMAYREKKIYSGSILEVEIYPISERDKKKPRKAKQKLSTPKQKNLNDKNARKHLNRLLNTNFTDKDLSLTLTYDQKNYPKSEEEAKKDVVNFLRRVRYHCKKNNLPPPKYIAVIEYKDPEKYKKGIRIHHHIVISGDINRDDIEKIWKKGRANADRLKADEYGYEALARYITKDPKGSKRWTQSKNLKQPKVRVNDHKYRKRKVEKIASNPEDRIEFEKMYQGYTFTKCNVVHNEMTGIHLYIKFRNYKT